MQIRVRFAPSPTGELHIGGVRTALFNWLFARHHKGRFILRIEDTDILRSQENFTNSIIDNLKWLGLNWDEGPEVGGEYGPYFQSQRLAIYKKYADYLLKEGKAYFCYCTPEELELRKKQMQKEGKPPVYDGHCRNLSYKEREKFEREGRKPTVRFKVFEGIELKVRDLLRGEVVFKSDVLGDFIILKSNGTPTFNFANVIDDSLMKITHVIRGDDHLSNTPRSQQFFEKEELIEKFSLERVNKSPAVFDPRKLEWMNAEYIRKMETEKLVNLLIPYLRKKGWVKEEIDSATYRKIFRITELERDRLHLLSDILEIADFFFEEEFAYDTKAVEKRLNKEYVYPLLKRIKVEIDKMEHLNEENLEVLLRNLSRELSLSTAEVFHPLRVALTGRMKGPGLFELAAVLGKEEVIRRINRALDWLKKHKVKSSV